jgi:hypothetical protein
MPLGMILRVTVILGCIVVGGIAGYKLALGNIDKTSAIVATISEPVVMRTKGGLLEVSTITATELFQATTTHRAFGWDVAKTYSQIRVPATYRYHIELAPEWRFEQQPPLQTGSGWLDFTNQQRHQTLNGQMMF